MFPCVIQAISLTAAINHNLTTAKCANLKMVLKFAAFVK